MEDSTKAVAAGDPRSPGSHRDVTAGGTTGLRPPETLALLLGPDLDVPLELRWAVQLAVARKMDLLVLLRMESREQRVVEVELDEPAEGKASGVVHQLRHVIEESPVLRAGPRAGVDVDPAEPGATPHVVHVRLKQVHFTSLTGLRKLMLAELRTNKVALCTAARRKLTDAKDVDLETERLLFFRYLPCPVVVCQGLEKGNALSNILVVAAGDRNGKAALQLGLDLAGTDQGTLTALHVNPDVGALAQQVGERRLDRILASSLDREDRAVVRRRVVVDNQIIRGVRRVWEEDQPDLVLVGAPQSRVESILGNKVGKRATVVVVGTVSPRINAFREFLEDGVRRIVPQITREDRIALVERLQSSAAWNFDFAALMVLSTIMAAIGLMQNSGAVVIGAMLVAPLMTPLLGLGLAIEQGNSVLARMSIHSIALGLGVSILGGFAVGFCNLGFEEPTREMLARGGPGLLDLAVAFAAGLAAAYANTRSNLVAALPGVAIAAALVPPIATSGLALSLGDFRLAIGALLLFGINMVTIVFATMTSLWLVGIRNPKQSPAEIRVVGIGIMIAVLALGVYLSLRSAEEELTEELPAGLVEAVREGLGTDFQLDGIAVAYDELGVQLHVSVVGESPAPEELATQVRVIAGDHYDRPVRVRLLTRIGIDVDAADPEPDAGP